MRLTNVELVKEGIGVEICWELLLSGYLRQHSLTDPSELLPAFQATKPTKLAEPKA